MRVSQAVSLGPARLMTVGPRSALASGLLAVLAGNGFALCHCETGEQAWATLASGEPCDTLILVGRATARGRATLLRRLDQDADLRHLPVVRQVDLKSRLGAGSGRAEPTAYPHLTPMISDLLGFLRSGVERYREQRAVRAILGGAGGTGVLLDRAEFTLRTLGEVRALCAALPYFGVQRAPLRTGIEALLVNAVEHGNLEIGYATKAALLRESRWAEEVARRAEDPRYRDRRVSVLLERGRDALMLLIRDQGQGFDWRNFRDFDPARAYDANGRGILLARTSGFAALDYLGSGNQVRILVTVAAPLPAGP